MKLTFQVPDIIIDNTKTEQLVELVTKASASLANSGSILLSNGDGRFDIYTLSDLTSSLIHSVSVNSPLGNISSDPLRPNIAITSVIPVVSGGIGTGSLTAGTLLLADSATSFRVLSGSNSTPNYAVIWDTGSNSYIMGKGGIDVEPTQDGQVLISSGTKFVANRLVEGSNIDITHTAGTASISTLASIYGIAAGTNIIKGGTANYPTMSLADQISLHAVTASHLFASTASIGVINYINENQLTIGDKYIIIMSGATDHTSLNESGIQWGSGSTAETVDDLGSNAHVRFISSSDSLEIWPRTTTPSLTASYISGAFYGDGSGITGVVAESVADGTKYALTGSTNNFTGSQYISGGLYVTGSSSFTTNYFAVKDSDGYDRVVYDNYYFRVYAYTSVFSTISASSYQGITPGSVDGLQQYIYNNVTGSGSISVSNGTASLNSNVSVSTLSASSHVSASTYYGDGSQLSGIQTQVYVTDQITGSGTSINPFKLKESIQIVADVTASHFNGDGRYLLNIDAQHISGVLPTNHGGTGLSSFTSGALYIATNTSTLAAFTGSDSQIIGWDQVNRRWIATDTYPKTTYTITAGAFSAGQIVALSGALVLADKSDLKKSNAIGVVSFVSGTTAVVQTGGEAYVSGAISYTAIGDEIWVGSSGVATNFAGIGSGNYATRLGYINRAGGYVMLQINPVYKLA
jgi:hypothetical protein